MSYRARAIAVTIAGCSLLLAAKGCTEGQRVTIRGRTIPGATESDEHSVLCDRPVRMIQAAGDLGQVMSMAVDLIRGDRPGEIAYAMIQIERWADSEERRGALRSLGAECLKSRDPLVRWSGIHATRTLGETEATCALLTIEYCSLSTRPESSPQPRDAIFLTRTAPAVALALLRADLIRSVGECRLSAATPVLEAIVADRREWHEGAREAAREALARIDSPR